VIIYKPLKTRSYLVKTAGPRGLLFMFCSNVAKRKGDVKPQGNGVMRDGAPQA
jgi:hypothetical protein